MRGTLSKKLYQQAVSTTVGKSKRITKLTHRLLKKAYTSLKREVPVTHRKVSKRQRRIAIK